MERVINLKSAPILTFPQGKEQRKVVQPVLHQTSASASAPLAGEADLRTDDTNVSELVRIASKANEQELCSESEILRAWSKSKTVTEGRRGVKHDKPDNRANLSR